MQPLPLRLLSKPQRSGCPDGGLNAGEPLTLRPHGGMGGFSWAVAGFLLGQGEAKITDDDKARVAREIGSTFATSYGHHITLEQMLDPKMMQVYQAQSSNQKALVTPQVLGGARL